MCKEFSCLPTEAMRELEEAPIGLVTDIITMRDYAEAKQIIKHAQREEDIPDSPIIDLVFEVEAEIFKDRKRENE